ncbi:FeoA family protein [Humibacillus sp. DSM 29435]|uniref:FeoA family protein n=1 Tax=Humibacillus sp. DSM 29435 TaxID=1869167 RepID=UPI0009F2248C|nr:FeoA family protein [Humibacillus sp. DSM 29435]
MSLVSTALRERVIEPCPANDHGRRLTLADLRAGDTAHIVELSTSTDPATARRLFDLGFAPGAPVQMLRRAPMADPVIFRLAGYEVALRRVHARCVGVSADL